jgi:hypothetical protein
LFKFAAARAVRLLATGFVVAQIAMAAEPPGDTGGQTAGPQDGAVNGLWVAPELANASNASFIAQLQKNAAAGNPNAQAALGLCYQSGHGMPRDFAAAAHWYELAARAGHAGAQTNLGALYEAGTGVPKDLAKAVESYLAAAQQGFAEAEYQMGWHYSHGSGVSPDPAQARAWYEKAAAQGNLRAMTNLGNSYFTGRGVPINVERARSYYQKPAESGILEAQFGLAMAYLTQENYAEGLPWLRRAAEAGNGGAAYSLAVCFRYGRGGPRDPAQALIWARKAVQNVAQMNPKGAADAHALLARILLDQPSEMHDTEAFREACLAAQAGNAEGEYVLGSCYVKGAGVAKDLATGVKWYLDAAQKNDPTAAGTIGAYYEKGIGLPQNFSEALKWNKVSAEAGNTRAEYNLGRAYRDGLGTAINLDAALKWLRAAAKGDPNDQEYASALTELQGRARSMDPEAAYKEGIALVQAAKRDGGSMDEALKALTSASDQGHVLATIALSALYRRGDHVPKNDELADTLIAKVQTSPNPAIQFQIGLSYMPAANQMPAEKNIDCALGHLQRAVGQGYGPASGPLGFCYMTASPAHQDFVSAFEWLSVAAGRGDQNAGMFLERLRPRLTNAQTQEAMARLNEIRAQSKTSAPIGPGSAAPRPWVE